MQIHPIRREPIPLHRLGLCVGIGFALIYLAFLPPGIYSLDGNSMLAVAESLVTHQGVSVPPGLGSPGPDGRLYSDWYPLLSFLAVPTTFAALIISKIAHVPFHYLAAIFALSLSSLFTAVTAGIVVLLSLQLGSSARGAWIAAISFGFGTIALTYERTFYTEPLLALLFSSGLFLIFARSPGRIAGASCMAALAVLAKPTGVVLGPLLSCYLLAKRQPLRVCVLPSIGTFVGFAGYAAYNFSRFGNPLKFGGPARPFHITIMPVGVAGLIASPAWGLLWFCPAMILAVCGFRLALRSFRMEAFAILAVFVGLILLYGSYEYWSAGWSWGPRFLMPALPGLAALTGLLEGKWRKALIVLTVAGFLVNAPTLFSFYERYFAELKEAGVQVDPAFNWSVRESPVLHAWPAAVREAEEASHTPVKEIFGQRGAPSQTIENSRALRIVAVWWWVLPVVGISRWLGIVISLILVLLGCLVLLKSRPISTA